MNEPLHYFKNIITKDFYTDVKARWKEYFTLLEHHYEEVYKKGEVYHFSQRVPEYHGNSVFAESRTIEPGKNYTVECYDEMERLFLSSLSKQVYSDLDNEKIKVFCTLTINNLNFIINKIKGILLNEDHQKCQNEIIAKLQNCISYLNENYFSNPVNTLDKNPQKIQWLGKTNILATLFYDLWQGQDKGKGVAATPSQIKAQKKDIEALLINNFIDSKGKPFTASVISDYLNKSKPEKRAKKGVRIEL